MGDFLPLTYFCASFWNILQYNLGLYNVVILQGKLVADRVRLKCILIG